MLGVLGPEDRHHGLGSLYAPYTAPLPYDICGYKPAAVARRLRARRRVGQGNDGTGVKIAIVDAYDSPTLLTDAQQYFNINDPAHPLKTSQFTNDQPGNRRQRGCLWGEWLVRRAGT